MLNRADIYAQVMHSLKMTRCMGNIQPVKVMVEDVAKTAVEFPSTTSDDAGGSIQDQL